MRRIDSASAVSGCMVCSGEGPHEARSLRIIKPFKLDEVRGADTASACTAWHGDRGQGLWPPEGPHRNLSRRRICRELPAQDPRSRSRSTPPIWSTRPSTAIGNAAKTGQIGDGKIFVTVARTTRCASAPARPTLTRSDSVTSNRKRLPGRARMTVTATSPPCARHRHAAQASIATPAFAHGGAAIQDRRRRHRLDDRRHRAGADDDASGAGAVLSRHGAQEERAGHHGAEPLGAGAWSPCCGSWSATASPSSATARCWARSSARSLHGIGMDTISPLAKTIPESLFMLYQMTFAIITVALVGRLGRRPHALLGISVVLRRLWLLRGLCADRPLGVGRRLPGRGRRARFRRRPRGAPQRRHRRPRRLRACSASAAAMAADNLAPFDLSLAVIGTGLLWVGWFGFNGGSALGASTARRLRHPRRRISRPARAC